MRLGIIGLLTLPPIIGALLDDTVGSSCRPPRDGDFRCFFTCVTFLLAFFFTASPAFLLVSLVVCPPRASVELTVPTENTAERKIANSNAVALVDVEFSILFSLSF